MLTGVLKQLWFLIWRNVDELPKPLIIRWQEYRLRALLRHHFIGNPFYRNLLRNSNLKFNDLLGFKLKDLSRLPIFNKDTFRDRGVGQCIAQNIPKYRFDIRSTSGSTGEPFRFPADRKYLRLTNFMCSKIWRDQWSDKTHPRILYIHALPKENIYSDQLYLNGLDLYNDSKTAYLLKRAFGFRADIIESFPGFYLELCRRIGESQIFKKPLFKLAVSVAETLRDADRNFIEETLGCKVFNQYALKEFFCVGRECRARRGFHLNAGSYILEILDNTNRPVEPCKEGNVVLTNLDNEIMPFIRYKTGDRGTIIINEGCPCGSNEPLFTIQGRATPKILEVGGKKINPFVFYKAFYEQGDYIRQYQIAKTSSDSIVIRIVPASKFEMNMLPHLENKIKEILGSDQVGVTFDIREKILPGPHGKRQDFMDEEKTRSI